MAGGMERAQLLQSWRKWGTAILALVLGASFANACTQLPESKVPEPARNAEVAGECPEQPNPRAFTLECLAWAEAQEAFAALGLEALRLGRIDPTVFMLDPASGAVKVDEASFTSLAGDQLKPLHQALDKVNGDIFGRAALVSAYTKTNSLSNQALCPPTVYPVNVKRAEDQAPGIEVFRWVFTAKPPTDQQLETCFQALYSPIPEGCPVIPSVYATGGCAQTTGLFPSRLPPVDASKAKAAPPPVEATARRSGRCGTCGSVCATAESARSVDKFYEGSYCGSC